MKLAEALAQRSECQTRLEELKKRLVRNARVQEGEQPAEDPQALLDEVDRLSSQLMDLIRAINRTNSSTSFDKRTTIADAIAERDVVGRKRDLLAAVSEAASTRQDRYSKSEVRFIATIPVGKVQRQVDDLARQYREIDTRIQELNWKTEIA